ncbi:MAG: ABC transporter ATP-binding protein [Opitutales bacterium]
MSQPVIEANHLAKEYRLGVIGARTLRDEISGLWQRWRDPDRQQPDDRQQINQRFMALEDVTFTARAGEILGIIGKNGAGKSTLLKVLSRITEPTRGEARLRGRTASLLEVGTGFHPELSGRDNIFLNGAILGMNRAEIRRAFDAIVAFADIEAFLDTPVKRYSSGMYVRLAFAIAAHLEAEILIADEVLAVGDVNFQRKSLGRMRDITREGRTVLFVSHNMTLISRYCERALLLEGGRLTLDTANIQEAIHRYGGEGTEVEPNRGDYGAFVLEGFARSEERPAYRTNEPVTLTITYRLTEPVPGFVLGLNILSTENDRLVFSAHADHQRDLPTGEPGRYRTEVTIPPDLLTTGVYEAYLLACSHNRKNYTDMRHRVSFEVVNVGGLGENYFYQNTLSGLVRPPMNWETRERPASECSPDPES